VLNAIGAFVYLWRVSLSWVIPQEQGLRSATGEPFIWAVAALPVFAVCFLMNLTWAVLILIRRDWQSGRLWLLTTVIWLISILIDFSHH
jgi:hypothetical protein